MAFGRHLVTVAAVVPLVWLGACSGDDPEPTFSPPSQSPSASESSPTEPVVRPWEKKTEAGAVAFAKHWIDDVFTSALKNGRTDDLVRLSASGCISCAAYSKRIDSINANGGFYRSPGWRVLEASAAKGLPPGSASVALRVLQGKEVFKEAAGDDVVRNPVSRASYEASLEWVDGSWRMAELRLLS